MKVAVIGCGNIANAAHIPAYMKNAEVEIVYFCDILLDRAEAAVEKYGCGQGRPRLSRRPKDRNRGGLGLHSQQRPRLHCHRCVKGGQTCPVREARCPHL